MYKKWHTSSWQLYLGVLMLALTTLLGSLYAVSLGKTIGNKYTHLIDAVMNVKFLMATTQKNLYKMYYEGTDVKKDLREYEDSLSEVEKEVKSLLDGNVQTGGNIYPFIEESHRTKATYILEMVLKHKNYLKKVVDRQSLNKCFSDHSEEMLDRYNVMLSMVDELEFDLHATIDQELTNLTRIQFLLLLFSVVVAVSVIMFFKTSARKINEYVDQLFLFQDELTEAKNEAELANKTKTTFLAHVGHEIRTPMNAILGMSEILLETELSSDQEQYVKTINNAGSVLLALINDLLDLSKIESGFFHIDTIKFSPTQVISQVQEIMQKGVNDKRLELLIEISPEVKKFYAGDPSRLMQIFINLVGNAIKFTEQGTITVKAEVGKSIDNLDELVFSVRDSGIGIQQDQLEKIFESFVQADNSIFRKYGGTGLGLTISKKLVNLMHGEIWPESKVGAGSTFFFTLPLKVCHEQFSDAEKVKNSIDVNSIKNRPLKILLVDDSFDNRLIIKTFFKKYPYMIDEASDGRDAIELFTHKEYDVVLMDMNMPILDGYEATKIIRKWERANKKRARPIIALTAYGLKQELELSLAAGCTEHITKPIRKDTLLKYIERSLDLTVNSSDIYLKA